MIASPLISVIIPTFNRANIIIETLDSIIAQTYQNWECIVVDDGSEDNTHEIVGNYVEKDKRFSFLARSENVKKGPSSCRNLGYEQSKGEYIQWFDSDDLMHPDKLKIKLDFALKQEADVIIDKHSKTGAYTEIQDFQFDCFTSEDFYIDYILGKKPVITNDVMLRRTIIKDNRFDENLRKGEEYEFYSRIFQQKLTYCFLEVALTNYRISVDSISRANNQSESLIILSKKLQKKHEFNNLIVNKAKRQGRKTYTHLAKHRELTVIFKHFTFFKNAFNKGTMVFFFYVCYNYLTGKGFDKMKP